jgi:predicted alternative tryptophan synthase beta-subunit
MHTLGHDFMPAPIHAGGLRYHGIAPTISVLAQEKQIHTVAVNQVDAFEAAKLFIRSEGIIPSPESTHAIKAVCDDARNCAKTNTEKTILFALTGHGFFDMTAYDQFFNGTLNHTSIPRRRSLNPWRNYASCTHG